MEASIRKDGDITIVVLKGYLDFETSEPFRKICFQKLINQNVIFDLKGLHFVGSSGLTPFIEVLKQFAVQNVLLTKFCGLNSEFRRLFFANFLTDLEIYEDSPTAFASFYQPMQQIQKVYYTTEVTVENDIESDSEASGETSSETQSDTPVPPTTENIVLE